MINSVILMKTIPYHTTERQTKIHTRADGETLGGKQRMRQNLE